MLEGDETSEEQATASEEDHGQRNLRDDEHVAQLLAATSHDGSPGGRLQRVVRVDARDLKGRGSAKSTLTTPRAARAPAVVRAAVPACAPLHSGGGAHRP
jgi:hypothetical protein